MRSLRAIFPSVGLFIAATALSLHADAQKKIASKMTDKKTTTPATKPAPGFTRTDKGLEYKFVVNTHGTKKPGIGDYVEMNIHVHIKDSVLFDSRKMNNNQPVPFPIQKPSFDGDPVEGFMMMSAGDSAVFRLPLELLKNPNMLPWMKPDMIVEYDVVMVSVKTQAEMQKASAEKAAQQTGVDDKLLQDYFAKNNLHPQKTASGLYYAITTPGTGANAASGQNVTVNYTGKTMDGKKFDSNVDPDFKHVQPFSFALGRGQVIKGWDEGVALMNKGAKATLYIPSPLAYGERSPSAAIPTNAVLIFDVEVTEIK